MAKKYPFVLDPFQKVSIACIVRPGLPAGATVHFLLYHDSKPAKGL